MAVERAILLLYAFRPPYADMVVQYVRAFPRYSRHRVVSVNTAHGFPRGFARLRFPVVVLHWSLFGSVPYELDARFLAYLDASRDAYTVAFFQDEYRFWEERGAFIRDYGVDCVFTAIEPRYWPETYGRFAPGRRLVHALTGYVGPELLAQAARHSREDAARTIDIGYRARSVPAYLGEAGSEKSRIGEEFVARARALGLRLDISVSAEDRLYGRDWWRFLGNCRGTLGSESGASFSDLDGEVRREYDRLASDEPGLTWERLRELAPDVVARWRDVAPIRAISPRHLEAAASRSCLVLFPGRYSGLLQENRHYLPLAKDFSNLEEVVGRFRDPWVRRELTERCHADLIASGELGYERFVSGFDRVVADSGALAAHGRLPSVVREARLRPLDASRRAREAFAARRVVTRRALGAFKRRVVGPSRRIR